MSAMLVGAMTMKMFDYCVTQSQYARVLPAYHAAMFVMARTRSSVNVDKFSRRVRAPMYVHLYISLEKMTYTTRKPSRRPGAESLS